jgi:hypothetical protein
MTGQITAYRTAKRRGAQRVLVLVTAALALARNPPRGAPLLVTARCEPPEAPVGRPRYVALHRSVAALTCGTRIGSPQGRAEADERICIGNGLVS